MLEVTTSEAVKNIVSAAALAHFDMLSGPHSEEFPAEDIKKQFIEAGIPTKDLSLGDNPSEDDFRTLLEKRSEEASRDPQTIQRLLGILDMLWMTNLENLDALSESVGLRAYGQKDPLVEYRQEAHHLFRDFWANFNGWIFTNLFRMTSDKGQVTNNGAPVVHSHKLPAQSSIGGDKVGRNDLCPCGSGKKYKKCHGA